MKHLHLIFLVICLWSCTKQKRKINEINVNFERATDFNNRGQQDSAFYYFFAAKDLATVKNDSLTIGKCLVNLAIISTNNRDYLAGQEFSLDALPYLNKQTKEHRSYLSYNYNNLGNASQNLRDYDEAIEFYNLAIKLSDNPKTVNVFLNNKAYLFQEIKQYKEALIIYENIQKEGVQDHIEYARTLSNIAFTKWQLDTKFNAAPYLLKALNIREKENDHWGKNSSYYYLAGFYEKKNPDSALFFAKKMYAVANELNSPDDKLYALQKLTQLSPAQFKNNYFNQYLKIDDSALVVRNKDKRQFALIRYRSKKNEEENFKLQRDNEEKKYQLLLILSATVLVIIGSIIWHRRRKLEAENTIRENRLKTSKKVHDKVANNIYRVMSEVEYKDDLDKTHLLDQLEHIYNTSRDISYEITEPRQNKTFSQLLFSLFFSYNSDKRLVEVVGNDEELWTGVPENTKNEISIILMELMTNMKKHSHATVVNIGFRKNQNTISIIYHDNGIGLSGNVIQGNGLKSTETRIKNISGTITFDSAERAGLRINIAFPAN